MALYCYKNHIMRPLEPFIVGGEVISLLVRLTLERGWFKSWPETGTVPLSTQVYKWVASNSILGGNPAMD